MMILMLAASFPLSAAEGGAHPHHFAVAGGVAAHDSETSGYIGVDYAYRFKNDWALGAFYEEVRGDFDLRAAGLIVGRYFASGWKVGMGPGVEYKIKKDKTLYLFHVSAGYDWHRGSWSYGPVASVDFIEGGKQTYYLGFAVGYGF